MPWAEQREVHEVTRAANLGRTRDGNFGVMNLGVFATLLTVAIVVLVVLLIARRRR